MPHISEAAPLQISRFYTGLFTYRNPLIVPVKMMGRRIIELYDSLSDGLNMEMSNRQTLVRRPGFTPVNSTPCHGRVLNFFTFKPSNFPKQIYNLVDTTTDIEYVQSASATPPQVIYSKQTQEMTTFAQVGAFLYMANPGFLKKWDSPGGIQGITNWGIDITSMEGSTGFHTPGTSQVQPLPANPSAPGWTNPGAIVGVAASSTARQEPGASPRAQEDMLNWLGLSSRLTQHLTGDLWEAVVFDFDPGYPSTYPSQTGFFIKNVLGNPWDIFTYDQNYAIKHWITEDGDSPDQPYCQGLGYPSCWNYARAYKRFLNPCPIMPRYFTTGSTVTIDTPGPNRVNRTVDCEQNLSAVISLGDVRGVTSGPFNYAWGGSIDGGTKPGGNGPQAGVTPTIKNEYYFSGTIAANNFLDRETTYYVYGVGRVAWYAHHRSSPTAAWVLQNFKVNNTITAGGSPTPNFPCGAGKSWWAATPPPPLSGFSLLASASTMTVTAGQSAQNTIFIVYAAGFTAPVTLALSGLPPGVTATLLPNPTTTSATLNISTTSTATGTAILTVTGTASGSTAATVNIGLGISTTPPQPPPPPPPGSGASTTLTRDTSTATAGPNGPSSWLGLWQHMQNSAVHDSNFATQNLGPCETSTVFVAGGFGFNLPVNAVILGIEVQVIAQTVFVLDGSAAPFNLRDIRVAKAGIAVGENRSTNASYSTAIDNTYGNRATDLWGTSWTAADINNPEFGVQLIFDNESSTEITMGIDYVSMTVDYTVPADQSTLVSQWLFVRYYQFNLPPPTPAPYVTGFQIGLGGLETQGDGISLNVGLTSNGSLIGATRNVQLPANGSGLTLGGSSDMWGADLSTNDVNQVDFGVAIQAVNTSAITAQFNLTTVSLNVFYVYGPFVSQTSGTMNPENGYQYVWCYGNSVTGHLSSPTYPSGMIAGPTTPRPTGINILLQASPDPQVNQIHLFRTTDGGGNPFYELPTSPYRNVTQTVTDNADDSALQIANVAPQLHFNDPPPPGAIDPVWFGGRLWMHQKNLLYFASGPDVTMGSGEEAWYPAYVFSLPHEIVRKFATPNGMIVVTNDAMYIVRGISTASFTVNEYMRDIGMRTWTAGDSDGSNIYMYTSDRQLLLINSNGLTSISQYIADAISAVDPSQAYLAQYRYTAVDNYLFLSDGSTFIYPFNVELQGWGTVAAPIGGVGAIGSVEVSPGVWQFWRARPTSGSLVSYRDHSTFRDEGYTYSCYATFGPIPVADFLTLAQVRDLVIATARTSTRKYISVLANEITPMGKQQYQIIVPQSSEPPELTESLSYEATRYTWMSSSFPELVNFVFLRIDFRAEDNLDELFAWTLGGTQTTGGSSLGAPGQLPQIQGR